MDPLRAERTAVGAGEGAGEGAVGVVETGDGDWTTGCGVEGAGVCRACCPEDWDRPAPKKLVENPKPEEGVTGVRGTTTLARFSVEGSSISEISFSSASEKTVA